MNAHIFKASFDRSAFVFQVAAHALMPSVMFKVNDLSVCVGIVKFSSIAFDCAKEVMVIKTVAGKLTTPKQKTI